MVWKNAEAGRGATPYRLQILSGQTTYNIS